MGVDGLPRARRTVPDKRGWIRAASGNAHPKPDQDGYPCFHRPRRVMQPNTRSLGAGGKPSASSTGERDSWRGGNVESWR